MAVINDQLESVSNALLQTTGCHLGLNIPLVVSDQPYEITYFPIYSNLSTIIPRLPLLAYLTEAIMAGGSLPFSLTEVRTHIRHDSSEGTASVLHVQQSVYTPAHSRDSLLCEWLFQVHLMVIAAELPVIHFRLTGHDKLPDGQQLETKRALTHLELQQQRQQWRAGNSYAVSYATYPTGNRNIQLPLPEESQRVLQRVNIGIGLAQAYVHAITSMEHRNCLQVLDELQRTITQLRWQIAVTNATLAAADAVRVNADPEPIVLSVLTNTLRAGDGVYHYRRAIDQLVNGPALLAMLRSREPVTEHRPVESRALSRLIIKEKQNEQRSSEPAGS